MHGSLFPFFEDPLLLDCKALSPEGFQGHQWAPLERSTLSPMTCSHLALLLSWHGSKGVVVVRALTSHKCGPGSNPGFDPICGLSLLLVLSFALRGFSLGSPVFPSP